MKNNILHRKLLFAVSFAVLHLMSLYAQVPLDNNDNALNQRGTKELILGPGGITRGLKVWLRADDLNSVVVDNNTTDVSVWKDQTGSNDYSFAALTGSTRFVKPTYMPSEEKMNFFPSIHFTAWAYLAIASGPLSTNTPLDFTSFSSYYNEDVKTESRLYTHGFGTTYPGNTTRTPALGFQPSSGAGRIYSSGGGPSEINGTLLGFTKNSTALEMIHTHKGTRSPVASREDGYVDFNFAGEQQRVDYTNASGSQASWQSFGSGFRMASGGVLAGASYTPAESRNASFIGLISDFLIYENILTSDEIEKINTYLGIKYAITLDKDKNSETVNYNYVLSGATSVWDGNSAPNNGYHNNVAGIVRDDASLFVNKAKSTSGEGTIGMMVQGHSLKGQGDNVSTLFKNDQSGLFWGDDLGKEITSFTQSADECFKFTERTSRVWLVQKTNLDRMPVTIFAGAAGAGELDKYMNSSYQAYMLVAKSKEDLDNKTWDMVIPGFFDSDDNYHKFNYNFSQEYTYFTLAFEQVNNNCSSCTFKGIDKFTFSTANIGNKTSISVKGGSSLTLSNLQTDNGNVTISNIIFEAESGVGRMSIRPNGKQKAVNINSNGNAGAICRITYELSSPASASFAIGDIDEDEIATVYAYCDGIKVYPESVYQEALVGSYKNRGYSFTYSSTKSTGTGSGMQSAGRGNPRGILHFDFGFAVEKIVIEYTKKTAGIRYLDLFPIEFYCPQPMPSPNEAGYAIQKQGTYSTHVCDVVDYKFNILNANSNCESSRVHFEDILPENMKWLPNSLSFDGNLLDTKVEDKGGQSIVLSGRTLTIDSLMLPGNGTKTVVRAQAIFNDDAPINMTYYNQSSITYLRKDNNLSETLSSTDLSFIENVDTDRRTPTIVTNDARNYKYLTADLSYKPSECFRENNKIIVTIKVNNPNASLSDMYLDLDYNQNFNYVKGSFQINGVTPSGIKELGDVDDEGVSMPGYSTVSGFTLPSGESVITYAILVPPLTDLTYEIDSETGKRVYDSLSFGFDIDTEAEDGVCLENAFLYTNGNAELSYCTSRKYIVTNKHGTHVIVK